MLATLKILTIRGQLIVILAIFGKDLIITINLYLKSELGTQIMLALVF